MENSIPDLWFPSRQNHFKKLIQTDFSFHCSSALPTSFLSGIISDAIFPLAQNSSRCCSASMVDLVHHAFCDRHRYAIRGFRIPSLDRRKTESSLFLLSDGNTLFFHRCVDAVYPTGLSWTPHSLPYLCWIQHQFQHHQKADEGRLISYVQ